ncbi:MAG: hypothetical protein KKG33_01925 [candidate division Zixibacteria bacterium]|nr:hypothetical protein [candidate division Zixibacteria bacterium]
MSDEGIKNDSWEFFRRLGNLAQFNEGRQDGWIEVHAFDDGNMPTHGNSRIGSTLPFYGLQDVRAIRLSESFSPSDIRALCRECNRAPAFVLIDRYCVLPDDFIRNAIDFYKSGKTEILGFKIVT